MIPLNDAEWMRELASGRIRVHDIRPGFAQLRPEWVYRGRSAEWHVVYLLTAGGIAGQWRNERRVLTAGTLLWMAPGLLHDLLPNPRPTAYFLAFRTDLNGTPCRPQRDKVILSDTASFKIWFEQLFTEQDAPQPYRGVRLQAQFMLFFSAMFRAADAVGGNAQLSEAQRGRLLHVVRARMREKLSPGALAEVLGLSGAYFTRVFKRTYGVSPRTWLAQKRIEAAAGRLLEDDSPIGEVAEELGYADIYAFSHQFRTAMGCSPKTFRTRHRRR